MGFYSNVVFPHFYDCVVCHKEFDLKRVGTLAKAQGKILEIGIGTGQNLEFYPSSVIEITAIEPNIGMKMALEKKSREHRIKIEFHLGGAEAMPFKDEEFDTVVSTITFCSIPHLQKAFSEIKRVLRPQGRLIFLDHGLSPEKKVARWQRVLNPLQKMIGAGCQLTLDIEAELLRAGFRILEIKKYHIDNAPKFISFVYEGVATK